MKFQDYYDEIGAYIQSKFPAGITQETADDICESLIEEFSEANIPITLRAKLVGERAEVQAAIPTHLQLPLITYIRTRKMEVTGVFHGAFH